MNPEISKYKKMVLGFITKAWTCVEISHALSLKVLNSISASVFKLIFLYKTSYFWYFGIGALLENGQTFRFIYLLLAFGRQNKIFDFIRPACSRVIIILGRAVSWFCCISVHWGLHLKGLNRYVQNKTKQLRRVVTRWQIASIEKTQKCIYEYVN